MTWKGKCVYGAGQTLSYNKYNLKPQTSEKQAKEILIRRRNTLRESMRKGHSLPWGKPAGTKNVRYLSFPYGTPQSAGRDTRAPGFSDVLTKGCLSHTFRQSHKTPGKNRQHLYEGKIKFYFSTLSLLIYKEDDIAWSPLYNNPEGGQETKTVTKVCPRMGHSAGKAGVREQDDNGSNPESPSIVFSACSRIRSLQKEQAQEIIPVKSLHRGGKALSFGYQRSTSQEEYMGGSRRVALRPKPLFHAVDEEDGDTAAERSHQIHLSSAIRKTSFCDLKCPYIPYWTPSMQQQKSIVKAPSPSSQQGSKLCLSEKVEGSWEAELDLPEFHDEITFPILEVTTNAEFKSSAWSVDFSLQRSPVNIASPVKTPDTMII
ncbi:hypothetical protein P7K49_029553 [Saguinus oedipus]|uniref:Sodium/hydrogen exchanger regulatory region domain-containing protein n=1 Tax=Saguinus oedipus TaxID=9490 RepID=A0ABQ9U8B0_SAGOE|nr:hypothetical protein P7K49_029553 [Saguinus oedipus]